MTETIKLDAIGRTLQVTKTADLRWSKDGKLQQRHEVVEIKHVYPGQVIDQVANEWRDVPTEGEGKP
jgi:hypothetical protein